jgi:cytochrome c oxidase subunit III
VYLIGHRGYDFAGDVFYANFFMATGFHGFHVIIGTIFLAMCYFRVCGPFHRRTPCRF